MSNWYKSIDINIKNNIDPNKIVDLLNILIDIITKIITKIKPPTIKSIGFNLLKSKFACLLPENSLSILVSSFSLKYIFTTPYIRVL